MWNIGTKDDAVYIERRSEADERVFEALVTPDEARELAALLVKHADKQDPPSETVK